MQRLLKRMIILLALAGIAFLVWGQRYRIASIENNNLKIQGTWYRFEMDRKGVTPYHFAERIITVDGTEWGSYELYKNTEIEVMVGTDLTLYELSFPDNESMVWSMEIDGKMTPVIEWRE